MLKRVPNQQTIVDHQRSLCRTVIHVHVYSQVEPYFQHCRDTDQQWRITVIACLSHFHKGWFSEWSHHQKPNSVLNLDIKIKSIIFDFQNGAVKHVFLNGFLSNLVLRSTFSSLMLFPTWSGRNTEAKV